MGIPRIAVFASGAGSNAANLIAHFKTRPCAEIALIVCNKQQAGVYEVARRADVRVVYVPKSSLESGDELLEVLRDEQIDWIVLAGFLLRIPEWLIKEFSNRIVNIHPSLLPKYGGRGMYGHFVHEAVHRNREGESGITIHFVNEAYDEGKMIFQASTRLLEDDTPGEIEAKVRELERIHFPEIIERLVCLNEISPTPQ